MRTLSIAVIAATSLCAAHAQAPAGDAKLSQALGFASRLTNDTELVMGLRDFEQLATAVGASKTWGEITSLLAEQADVNVADGAPIWGEVMNFIGKDVFVAFGKGTTAEIERLIDVYSVYDRISSKVTAQSLLSMIGIGDGALAKGQIIAMIAEALKADDGKMLAVLENVQLAPVIIGARVPKGKGAQLLEQISAIEAQLPPIVLTSEFEVAGVGKFRSWSLAAKDAFADEHRAKMREQLDNAELSAQLEKIIDTKKIEISFGVVGDHIVVGIGPDHSHLKFAANGAESLAAIGDFEFINGYTDKKLLCYSYAAKGLLAAFNQPEQLKTLTDIVADALRDMLDGGIDVAKAIPLINKLGDQLVAASKRDIDAVAAVAYLENGLKGASIGGYNMPGVDVDTPLKLVSAAPADAFLTFNIAGTADMENAAVAIIENLVGAAYHITAGVAKAEGNEQFGEQFEAMDGLFRSKLLKVWTIIRDKVGKGLGEEGGMVVDLKGSMPKIPNPNIPTVIIKEGKLPRIAVFRTVEDRKLLAEAWTELVPALNDIAKSIPGQEAGREFQLPDSLSSDGKNVKTHFMGLPFVSNDFLPSLSISDELFFLSTSKNFSEELAAQIAAGGGEEVTGILLRVRLSALHKYAEGWLDLVREHSGELFDGNEFAEEQFKENFVKIRKALDLLKGIKGFEFHRFKDGRMRTDWHLEITDIE